MKTQELKEYINKTLGNSIRCLLPAYWWKRLFGLVIDRVDEVESNALEIAKSAKPLIVETEDELSKLKAETGSTASVLKTASKKFSDCHFEVVRGDESFSKLTRITNIRVNPLNEISIPDDYSEIRFFLTGINGEYCEFIIVNGGIGLNSYVLAQCKFNQDSQENFILSYLGVTSSSSVKALNNLLEQYDMRYVGQLLCNLLPTAANIVDNILSWGSSTEAFIQSGDSWERLVKKNELDAKSEYSPIMVGIVSESDKLYNECIERNKAAFQTLYESVSVMAQFPHIVMFGEPFGSYVVTVNDVYVNGQDAALLRVMRLNEREEYRLSYDGRVELWNTQSIGGGKVDTAMSDTSKNAVQNKVVKDYVDTAISQSITNTLNTAV